MQGAEELELDVRTESTTGQLQAGNPEIVSRRIRAKVYGCQPHAEIQGRGTVLRTEGAVAERGTDFPLGPIDESADCRVQAEPRSNRHDELPPDTVQVEWPIHHVAADVCAEAEWWECLLAETR